MRPHELPSELIAGRAAEFADKIRAAAATANNEEELRIEAERLLAFIQHEVGIKLEGRHEFTVASGRVDSVYDRVIIEYKNPANASSRVGPKADSPGVKKVVEQIKSRFYDMRTEHRQPLNTLFGVGLDGNHFVFVRFRDDKWQVQEPVEVNRHSAERFLWALFNLGAKGKPFSPEYLAADFGSEAKLAQGGIHALYDAVVSTDHPKARTFFSQWKILFSEVCGYQVDDPSDKIRKLADFYGVRGPHVKPAELLFAVHTYYALFMKLLASEIVAFVHKLPTPLQKMMQAGTSAKLMREMEDLEAGSIFRHFNITNFLEGDLFAWYTAVWTEPIEHLVRGMVTRLDSYNPGTLSEDPAASRDLLKKLYQQLFPKSVRHDLGEYYTPDWLAEHVLDELGYEGDPDKRILDPACGSGTFLVMAINRIRRWYDANRESQRYGEDDLCRKILSNVTGFDLNPLAVMAARTNYLIAIRDLVARVEHVEIPVYLCDSILTPSEYGGLFAGERLKKARELKTAAATFLVPTEVSQNRDDLSKYAAQLEFCIRNGYPAGEFVQRCRDEQLSVDAESLHVELYAELVALVAANKNGVWARIIKNAFAPLFVGQVDYVAGNPPWVRWGYLPKEYRDATVRLWQKYGLFSLKGYEARLGSGEKDLSQLFVYACIDNYLGRGGRLGFVITQTVFKAKGQAEGFRRFRLGQMGELFAIRSVDDFAKLKPFEGASNLTVSFVAEKGKATQYPVPYTIWTPKKRGVNTSLAQSLEEVTAACDRAIQLAHPVDKVKRNSQWQTASKAVGNALAQLAGPSRYKAKIGARTDPYGVFQVRVLKQVSKDLVLVENCADAGKTQLDRVQMPIETDLLYPLIRGRDVASWTAVPDVCVLMVQDPATRLAIPEKTLRSEYPRAYDYLRHFKPALLRRGSRAVQAVMEASAFYAMFAVGTETFSPYKVAWRRMGNVFHAAFVSSVDVPMLGERLVIPSDTVTFVPFDGEEEAFFFLGLLNSSPARAAIYSFSPSGRGLGAPAILKQLKIDGFRQADKSLRKDIARLARAVVRVHQSSIPERSWLDTQQEQLDSFAASYWGLSAKQLGDCRKEISGREHGTK